MKSTFLMIFSNVAARLLSVGLGIVLIPIYIKLIGAEAYGLIGFYATLSGALAILDLGLSRTLNREVARMTADKSTVESIRNLVFSLECIYIVIGLVLGLLIVLLSPLIANYWVNSDEIPKEEIMKSVMLMGGVFAFQWPQSMYAGALMGLQRHVSFNICIIIFSIIKSVGVILVLVYIAPSVFLFFLWQMVIGGLMVFALRILLWKYLPASKLKAVFSKIELQKIWKFAAGITGISLTTFFWTQLDKIILSKILSLKEFGYYTLAWAIGTSMLLVANFMGNVFLPKLTQVISKSQDTHLSEYFHRYNRLVISTTIPLSLILCVYSPEILMIWINDQEIVDSVSIGVSILVIGTMCNIVMHIPFYVMIAKGITKFTIYKNIISILFMVPLIFFAVNKWGLTGATLIWLVLNASNVIIILPLVHKLYMNSVSIWDTYFFDIGIALFISSVMIFVSKICCSWIENDLLFILCLALTAGLSYGLIILASKEYRTLFLKIINKRKVAKA